MHSLKSVLLLTGISLLAPAAISFGLEEPGPSTTQEWSSERVMLILRGIANDEYPRGVLDDEVALEYARRNGEVIDAAADYGPNSAQIRLALDRIRRDGSVTAIYGFSGAGYNTRMIWQQLNTIERERIRNIVIVGSPSVEEAQFAGNQVLIVPDPPEGHMAGPRSLLDSKTEIPAAIPREPLK
jgi:hypothetical protein